MSQEPILGILAKFKSPVITVLGAALLWASGYFFNQGANSQKQSDLEKRVSVLEQDRITTREYQELLRRLDRIENKVDRLGQK